ncbi:ubiquinol-cytochrome c reductase iron-sulfur subunit [Acetobacter thailandicus]|uniref:Ubiquinol-cytochrome c reductase iron-sulfur subunit n=1 Tax=Acetobacter thailandicus TaxID=1502842 RepID=A0ABT3QBB7_9PROT|nr:ubiquinol-cytochrome c reductase iron-sulfur subunit [Acetobacter thailandicus]MCX2562578.1 ubiquinol-cytochrome c reductase iron-sulfur subunit [Acetobacter thailandicus]NHN94644.1 ubiquinol-cytochrome c reductase iron-sulfur subunit [Acetobacter thailandicus]
MPTHPPSSPDTQDKQDDTQNPCRRDFLEMTAIAGAVTGAAACAIPFLQGLLPPESFSEHMPVDLDLSHLTPGEQLVTTWENKPVFIIHRTRDDLITLQEKTLREQLRDPDSQVQQQPAYARNWHRSLSPEYGVYVGICTHLGCVPSYSPPVGDNPEQNKGHYVCPCHGSHFDLAGRAFKNAPAPYNLPVPPYSMISPTHLRLGANPEGETFSFSTIVQI